MVVKLKKISMMIFTSRTTNYLKRENMIKNVAIVRNGMKNKKNKNKKRRKRKSRKKIRRRGKPNNKSKKSKRKVVCHNRSRARSSLRELHNIASLKKNNSSLNLINLRMPSLKNMVNLQKL